MPKFDNAIAAGLVGLAFLLNSASDVFAVGAVLTNSPAQNGTAIIGWSSRGVLESASQLSGPWTPVTNASNPYTNSIATNVAMFFRLNQTVDATTLHKKVLCGYQGWFRCAGDSGGGVNWDHWSRNWSAAPTPSTLTFEMWPDLAEYSNTYAVPGFTYPDSSQAYLYSADDQATVNLHFNWMQDYGIDGVVVQRFVTQTAGQPGGQVQPWKTNVLNYALAAAHRTGRVIAMEYDMSGADTNTLFTQLTNDWTSLTAQNIPQDSRFLHHNGKPVLIIFGFYTNRFADATLPQQIVNWFKTNTVQPVTLIGSGDWQWRTMTSTVGWSNLFRSFNGYLPWNTGNYFTTVTAGQTNYFAQTNYWAADLLAATNAGMFYLPEIYPGFSWHNLNSGPFNQVPRQGGNFLWQQFNAVSNFGLDWAYVGMFDEVDEGTAIYKVSNTPPTQGEFLTYDADGINLPTDWYLRLTAEGSKVISGEILNTTNIPISP